MYVSPTAGPPSERLCTPMVEYIKARGGELHLSQRLKEIELAPDGTVAAYKMVDGSRIEADLYVSSMPGTVAVSSLDCCHTIHGKKLGHNIEHQSFRAH